MFKTSKALPILELHPHPKVKSRCCLSSYVMFFYSFYPKLLLIIFAMPILHILSNCIYIFATPNCNLISQLEKAEGGIKVHTDHGEVILADVVLVATGRLPNTKRLNLDAVGVELDNMKAVKVDEYSRTNIPSIWAIGDVTNRMNLTPVALMEGTCFAKTVFGGKPTKPDYSHIPCAVFCIPPLSVVGFSEEQAIEQINGEVSVYTSSFNPMKNTISGRTEKSVMKLLVDAQTDKVIGASMCGPDAPEIMQGIAVALKCGATKEQFDSTVGIHPSAAEEFVTMRSESRRISSNKPKTNL